MHSSLGILSAELGDGCFCKTHGMLLPSKRPFSGSLGLVFANN